MKIDWEDDFDVEKKFKLISRLFPPVQNTLARLSNAMYEYKKHVNRRLKAKSQEEYDDLTVGVNECSDNIDATFEDLYRLFESFTTGDPSALVEDNRPD